MTQMNWSKLLNKTFLIAFFLTVNFTICFAQNDLETYKNEYPDYNELVLNDIKSYTISIEKNKLKVIQNSYNESIILTENGIQNNQESFTYSDLVKLTEYDAYSIITDKGREKKIKVTQTNEKNSEQNSVFHSDVKERQLIFSNLESGAKKVYSYQTEFVDPFLLQSSFFGGILPTKNTTFEVTFEKDISIGYKVFNDPNNTIQFSKTEKKGKNHYSWSLKNSKAIKYEPNSPGFLYQVPHVVMYIKEYSLDDKKIDVLDDVTKLFAYYQGFVKNLNKNEDLDLKKTTLDLVANLTTESDKIKAIFYWVKDNIKYIAFENGYEGFIPREASLINQRKFGDCKDMASIITSMAKYANINNVYISWIGTRKIPYSYNQLSTPAVDDHMIAVYKSGEDYIFLDATDKESRFGIPTAFIQGKEALVNENSKNYKIVQVPTVNPELNEIKDYVKLTINKDKLLGNGRIELNGYNRSHILMQIGDATNKTRFEMIKSLVLKGNNKFILKDNYSEENISNRDKSYNINYNFELDNYIIKLDKEIYINMFLDKIYEKFTIEKDRTAQYEFDFLTLSNYQYELEIPDTYKVKYIPKNYSLENDLLKVDINYEHKGNSLFLNSKINLKKLLLNKEDFELWNETIKKLKSNYTETVIINEK